MTSNNAFDFIQQGFRVAVGATASIVETIQDQQKREHTLNQLKTDLDQRTKEWAVKGEETEKEARRLVDQLLQKQSWQQTPTSGSERPAQPTSDDSAEAELQDLTQQITTLRKELENLRQEDD
jgi:polyhydroxyalkanoate synthesis regulator phasin